MYPVHDLYDYSIIIKKCIFDLIFLFKCSFLQVMRKEIHSVITTDHFVM